METKNKQRDIAFIVIHIMQEGKNSHMLPKIKELSEKLFPACIFIIVRISKVGSWA